MQSEAFEHAFSLFLDSREYDAAADLLFSAMRTAFLAGWKAADSQGEHLPEDLIYLLHRSDAADRK